MGDREREAARMMCVGFGGLALTDSLRELLDRGVSSVILFTRNYATPQQLCELGFEIKAAARQPILICVDQEGGRVQRFGEPFTIVPSMREIGRTNDENLAHEIGAILGRELRAVNIDMNIAPVLDVDSNPNNPVIGARSFGRDPDLVARMGCALLRGMQAAGIAACGKHFPGHGDANVDSHLDLPSLPHPMDRLQRIELPPFRAAIDAGVAAIMTSHIVFTALDADRPATLSRAVIHGLLRKAMRFDRVVISDDLEMKAIEGHVGVERAIIEGATAGVDLFMICSRADLQHRAIDTLIDGVKRGTIAAEAVVRANQRLDALFARFVRPASKWSEPSNAIIGCANHRNALRGAVA